MTQGDRVLKLLLRLLGVTTLLAVGAVVMPMAWMAETHRRLGMDELPLTPLVEYLARTASAFYAFFGALCLLAAADLERYRPLVRFLGIALVVMGIVFLGVDLSAGMPWWWAVCEGLPVLFGAAFVILARRKCRSAETADQPETASKC